MIDHEVSKKLAMLEFENDQLASEVAYINELLISVGFSDGLNSLKKAAEEILEETE